MLHVGHYVKYREKVFSIELAGGTQMGCNKSFLDMNLKKRKIGSWMEYIQKKTRQEKEKLVVLPVIRLGESQQPFCLLSGAQKTTKRRATKAHWSLVIRHPLNR